MRKSDQRTILGFGFRRIAHKDHFQGVHTYAAQMTHNTFIQALMNLGSSVSHAGIVPAEITMAGILIPIMINSFTEFGIFREINYGILFLPAARVLHQPQHPFIAYR